MLEKFSNFISQWRYLLSFLKNTQSYDIVEVNSSVLRWLIVLGKVD